MEYWGHVLLERTDVNILALRLKRLRGQGHEPSVILLQRTSVPCTGSCVSAWLEYTGTKKRTFLTVSIPLTKQTNESFGRITEEFSIYE